MNNIEVNLEAVASAVIQTGQDIIINIIPLSSRW